MEGLGLKTLVQYAKSFLGLNYLWGGANPLTGFDCSGLVDELLESAGIGLSLKPNAQGLYNHFMKFGVGNIREAGSLIFYGKSEQAISHVAFMIDANRVIEAGHGTSTITSKEAAALNGSFVRIRPYNYRGDIVGYIKPNYPEWINKDVL